MSFRVYKYLSPFLIFILAFIAFNAKGWLSFLPIIWGYVLIPLLELFIKPDKNNRSLAEEELIKKDRAYDFILYAVVPLQYAALIYFFFSLQSAGLTWVDYTGRIFSMGLLCGVFGINVGHELGHRINPIEQAMAKLLLMTSLYMHFFIEHNKGHHKNVATPSDPSSARLHESLFAFFPRTILGSFVSAWQIAASDLKKHGKPVLSFHNEMVIFLLAQVIAVLLVYTFFGIWIMFAFLAVSALGIGLLETVNYIEHYGLQRKEIEPGKYERAQPVHSWNSNHVLGRLMLFELSRHSDHHYMASRKYQTLRHFESSPQMPTGYPGMMILAHLPPLFFYIMDQQLKKQGIR